MFYCIYRSVVRYDICSYSDAVTLKCILCCATAGNLMRTYYEVFCCATPDLLRAATRAFAAPRRKPYVWHNNSLNQHRAIAEDGISTIVVEQM